MTLAILRWLRDRLGDLAMVLARRVHEREEASHA